MAITINVNQNNMVNALVDKAGNKDNKTIFAGNLNAISNTQSLVEEKRNQAKKQAMKVIGDAWDKDNKVSADIQKKLDKIDSRKSEINDYESKIRDLEDNKKELQESYGVADDSEDQKDLELLEKYQNYKNGSKIETFTKDEIARLKELQDIPRTEYQNKVLELNDAVGEFNKEIRSKKSDIAAMNEEIKDTRMEQIASHDMLDAYDAAEKIMEASSKEIIGILTNEMKSTIDEKFAEEKEKADKLAEEKEEKEEKLAEAKEKKEEQEALIEQSIEASRLEQDMKMQTQAYDNVADVQKDIQKILKDNNLVDEDLKGIKIDFNF
ncbi:MAG: hypothetical protein IJ053_01830 [Lachnospiraceae bacterium]|nr:hypothetical protein [Lachnospiraceae bacterium]